MKSLTWNLEGLKRNLLNLKYFIDLTHCDLIFISEPNVFNHDAQNLLKQLNNYYHFSLNSEDKFDEEAPFTKSKTHGGTMVLWRQEFDPYINIHPVSTTSFLPLIYSPPGSPTSIHIALYLPTSGQETEFLNQITELRVVIGNLSEIYPDSLFFIRGDSNVNPNNTRRAKIFADFCSDLNLISIPTQHKTYPHFLGEGLFDSSIDVILQSETAPYTEEILKIFCQDRFPEIDSHHDLILSSVSLPYQPVKPKEILLIKAPKIDHERHRVYWSEINIQKFEDMVAPELDRIRNSWPCINSQLSISVLLEMTNQILTQSATNTNDSTILGSYTKTKSLKVSKAVRAARLELRAAHGAFEEAVKYNSANTQELRDYVTKAKKQLRQVTRRVLHQDDIRRDTKLFSACSSSSAISLFKAIRSYKRTDIGDIPFLTVGDSKYPENMIGDGLFNSIQTLKTQDESSLQSSSMYDSWSNDFKYILEISRNKRDIPPISFDHSSKILHSMKPTVSDFWSVTPLHFLYAGYQGLLHFNFLMNRIISEINGSSVKELNTVMAILLYKGHGKSKTSDRSYRTISTCPVIAKAVDIYVHDLFIDLWNSVQATTQYQGHGSSHELASLMITEAVQHSSFSTKKPLFALFLDARSAFDVLVIKYLVRNLYFAGMSGNSLHYINNRLSNRITFLNWKNETMGPIYDEQGVEQGGCNSGDYYKIYNNQLLELLQASAQGVELKPGLVVSAVGQADDVCLLSNNIHSLFNLLHLASSYCEQHHVQLCVEKTKLLLLSQKWKEDIPFFNPIAMEGVPIPFSDKAEHVGVIRSPDGNLPHIVGRILAHKKAKGVTIFAGTARNHRGNPAASIFIEKLYNTPVLFSGLSSLVLSSSEVNSIDQHYLETLRNLLKLYPGTPQAFIYFISGCLPGKAVLHQRQLGLFNMVCNLPDDPLNHRARHVLTCASSSKKSWFHQIRQLCLLYDLPHPLHLLSTPTPKAEFCKVVKSHIINYWETKLRADLSSLDSLQYFKPEFSSLSKPHPMLWTAGSNPYEVTKAITQCRMLSGRYRSELLARHWSSNRSGYCLAPTCTLIHEDLAHILISCPAYMRTRLRLRNLWLSCKIQLLHNLLSSILIGPATDLIQFILEPSAHPQVISLSQNYGSDILRAVFHLTRTWCYTLHRERAKLLGRWP